MIYLAGLCPHPLTIAADATEKACCAERMNQAEAKKILHEYITKSRSKTDQAAAVSAQTKDKVKEIWAQPVATAKKQAEMD